MKTNEPTTIARVYDKAHNFICWSVKSNSSDKYYQVRCKKIGARCFWFCDCEASHWGYNGLNNTKGHCSHVKSVISVEKARAEMHKEQAIARVSLGCFFQVLSSVAKQLLRMEELAAIEEAERHLEDERKRKQAPLNGNQGFNLMRV